MMLNPKHVAALVSKCSKGSFDETPGRIVSDVIIERDELDAWTAVAAAAGTLDLVVRFYDRLDEETPLKLPGSYRVEITKAHTATTFYFFSTLGFRKFLFDDLLRSQANVIRVADAVQTFRSGSFEVAPWFRPVADDMSEVRSLDPRRYVRDFGSGAVPTSVNDWLLIEKPAAEDAVFSTWRSLAAMRLQVALASEAWKQDESVRIGLSGARYVTFTREDQPSAAAFEIANDAACWIYGDRADIEAKLVLYTAELARDWPDGHDSWSTIMERVGTVALSSAQRSYRQRLVATSSDTLKALGELRKVLSDDISRTVQGTRDLVAGSWRDFAIAIAALFARAALLAGGNGEGGTIGANVILYAVVAYLVLSGGVTIYSNLRFDANLRTDREIWRTRLYGFLSATEYEEFALVPLRRAAAVSGNSARWLLTGYIGLIVFLIATLLFEKPQQHKTVTDKHPFRRTEAARKVLDKPSRATTTPALRKATAR